VRRPSPRGPAAALLGLACPLIALLLVAAAAAASESTSAAAAEEGGTSMTLAPITPAKLAERMESGDAPLVIDVRSTREWYEGHIPGALHIPYRMLDKGIPLVPRDREVVVHCLGGGRASRAIPLFRNAGFPVLRRLEGDFSAWKRQGLPVETGEGTPSWEILGLPEPEKTKKARTKKE